MTLDTKAQYYKAISSQRATKCNLVKLRPHIQKPTIEINFSEDGMKLENGLSTLSDARLPSISVYIGAELRLTKAASTFLLFIQLLSSD